jgi:hypothetical protein
MISVAEGRSETTRTDGAYREVIDDGVTISFDIALENGRVLPLEMSAEEALAEFGVE